MSQRLQKVLAESGIGSRRQCEEIIRAGRVQVNGITATLGDKVDVVKDQITVDGVPLTLSLAYRYLKFHKPAGYLSSSRAQGGHPTIFTLISVAERLYPVGRLDVPSEGLMLLTNDGELANRLSHPRFQHEKEYRVLFRPIPSKDQMRRWREGLTLPDGYKTQPSPFELESRDGSQAWCRIILREGRKRQIRNMASVLGLTVLRLIRVRIATLELGDLPAGEWRDCTQKEIKALRAI